MSREVAGRQGREVRGREILGRVMLAFEGETVPERVVRRLADAPAAGMTLFRALNIRTPAQVRALTERFQHAGAASPHAAPAPSPDHAPLLVAADQEGGQFLSLGDGATPFAGNMALGAADDPDLTARVGRAIGLETRAMGVNVTYAPCIDLATNPANPALGIRAFGDDPSTVARHGVAMIRGLQSAGVAATVKHTPGLGDVSSDTHHGLAGVAAPRDVLDSREFVPFRAAFAEGVRLAMSGHFALPAVSGRADLPATLSRAVMTDLLRGDLGFDGLTISDALDMQALAQGPAQVLDVVAAVRAGVDLLLAPPDPVALDRIEDALVRALERDLFDRAEIAVSARRIDGLRRWLGEAGPAPDVALVGSAPHMDLARELARRSITLVRDPGGVLPLRPGRIVAVMPRPADLTPADTSSFVPASLASALRSRFTDVDEIVVGQRPDDAEIEGVRSRVAADDVSAVVVGTIDGHRQPEQIALVDAIVEASGGGPERRPVVAVAMRGPWDVSVYPASIAALATYSILPGSLEALATVLAGETEATGRLPVAVA